MEEVVWSRWNARGVNVVVPTLLCKILEQGCRAFMVSSDPCLLLELQKWSQISTPGTQSHSSLSKSISSILYEGGKYISVDIHWGFTICCQKMAVSEHYQSVVSTVSAHDLLILNMVAVLHYQHVVARFGCFLECTKVIQIPFCFEVQEVVRPLYYFIFFCLNKRLVKVCPFLLNLVEVLSAQFC